VFARWLTSRCWTDDVPKLTTALAYLPDEARERERWLRNGEIEALFSHLAGHPSVEDYAWAQANLQRRHERDPAGTYHLSALHPRDGRPRFATLDRLLGSRRGLGHERRVDEPLPDLAVDDGRQADTAEAQPRSTETTNSRMSGNA
jgi:hypothetical protein